MLSFLAIISMTPSNSNVNKYVCVVALLSLYFHEYAASIYFPQSNVNKCTNCRMEIMKNWKFCQVRMSFISTVYSREQRPCAVNTNICGKEKINYFNENKRSEVKELNVLFQMWTILVDCRVQALWKGRSSGYLYCNSFIFSFWHRDNSTILSRFHTHIPSMLVSQYYKIACLQ